MSVLPEGGVPASLRFLPAASYLTQKGVPPLLRTGSKASEKSPFPLARRGRSEQRYSIARSGLLFVSLTP